MAFRSKRYQEKMPKSKAVQGYTAQEEHFSALAPYKLVVIKLQEGNKYKAIFVSLDIGAIYMAPFFRQYPQRAE